MKRGLLISALMLAALSTSASVRGIVAEDTGRTSAKVQGPSTKNILGTWNMALGTLQHAPSPKPVAPYKRVEPLLPVVRDPSISTEHQQLANRMLRTLIPSRCIADLKHFYMFTEDLGSRGFAGPHTIMVDATLEEEELIAILIHETAHFLDLSGCTRGNPDSGVSAFKDEDVLMYNDDPSVLFYQLSWATENIQKRGMSSANFVTGYAKHNAFEDLAESVTYYVLRQKDFRTRAAKNAVLAQKLAWIETYIFPGGVDLAEQEGSAFNGKIPWDATKLAYTWKGKGERVAAR